METKTEFLSPVYNVKRIHMDKIRANAYNPNAVAPPEMKLLETSIWEDGYTMPIVCYYLEDVDMYEIVDGYHRFISLVENYRPDSTIMVKRLTNLDSEIMDVSLYETFNYDMDANTMFRQIYDSLYDVMKPQSIPRAVLILADYSYKQAFVADVEINTVACLTEIMVSVEFK